MKKKKLIKIAQDIAELENKMAQGKDIKSCKSKIQRIADTLSLEDMMYIDEYIMERKLIGK